MDIFDFLNIHCIIKSFKYFLINGKPLQLVDQFIYLDSNTLSTENDINKRIRKSLTGIDRLLIIWKSDISDKIFKDFFQDISVTLLS